MLRKITAAMAAAFLMISVSGCSNVGDWFKDNGTKAPIVSQETKEILAKAVVTTAVLKFIYSAGGRMKARAQNIVTATDAAIALVDGNVVSSLDAVEAEARKHIPFSQMKLEDASLVNILISVVKAEIAKQIGGKELRDDIKVKVVAVLGWVRDAANSVASVPTPLTP